MGARVEVLGIAFDSVSAELAADGIFFAARRRSDAPYTVFTPNALISMECRRDKSLLALVNSADLVLPDGSGVVGAAKRQGTPLPQRITGIDTADAVMARLAQVGGSVYLLGAERGIAERAARELQRRHAGLAVLGTSDGYFEDEEALVAEISRLSPDLLLVGMGFPRQEAFICRNRARLCVGAAVGVGGAIDVWAGRVRRAPAAFIALHAEWLWRMLCQPRRFGGIWRLFRYRLLTRRRFLGKK